MKVRTKLIIGFSAIVVLLWLIAFYAANNFWNLNRQFSAVEKDIIPDTITMTEVETISSDTYREMSRYLFYDVEEAKNTALIKLGQLEKIGTTYLPMMAMAGIEEHGKDSILAGRIYDFCLSAKWIIALKGRGADYEILVTRDRDMILPALLAVQQRASELKAANIQRLTNVRTDFDNAYKSGVDSIFLSAGAITLLAITAAFLTTRSIVRPLLSLRKGTEMIAQGDLGYRVGTGANDEIGQLSRAFDRMTQSLSVSMTSIDNLNQENDERKRVEKALRESEERFSKAFRSSPETIAITTFKEGKFIEVNDSFTRITGYTREEVIGRSSTEISIWANSKDRVRMLQLLKRNGTVYSQEFEFRMKSGELRTWLFSAEKIHIGGEPCLISIMTDITERKRAEEMLRFSDAAFKSIHESVIVTNLKGEITSWNEISEQLFGVKASEAVGRRFLEVIEVVETYPGETQDRIKKIQTQGHWEDERLYRTRRGDIWVDVHLQDIVDNGKHYGRIMLASDISQRKQAEAELKRALADLEQSSALLAATNKELEAFSYSVSHDLRSPLRSIDGFSQALLEDYRDKLDETGQDYLNRLRGSSQKMGELIDGLLKLSRLTRSEMHLEKVDLSALAEEIAARLQETQPERRVKFVIDKGLTAKGDPQLLRALLENLLGNAWKFTRNNPEAKIEFSLDKNDDKKAYFVTDNGAGFDMTYVDKLFGAFQRLHDTEEFPGTGIGLATVQRIINRHGGTIRAEGAVGKGATFHFTLN